MRRVNGPPTSALMLQDGSLHDCNLSLLLKSMLEDEGYVFRTTEEEMSGGMGKLHNGGHS